jgi:hypothetical protein
MRMCCLGPFQQAAGRADLCEAARKFVPIHTSPDAGGRPALSGHDQEPPALQTEHRRLMANRIRRRPAKSRRALIYASNTAGGCCRTALSSTPIDANLFTF